MKITDKIHQLKIPFTIPLTPEKNIERFVNIFIITGKGIYLIDTGAKGADGIVYEYLLSIGRKPDEITSVFLTHAHPDHIGALKPIKEKSGCSVYIHPAERNWVENTEQQFSERPVPGFHQLVSGPVAIDGDLTEGMSLQPEEGITFEVIHTPGHSDGSVSFFFKEQSALFTGDAVILPGELPIYTNVKEYLHSISRLKNRNDFEFLLSAWDKERYHGEIEKTFQQSIEYIGKIDRIVKEACKVNNNQTSGQLCELTLERLGLPAFLANPLLAKSFQSHIT